MTVEKEIFPLNSITVEEDRGVFKALAHLKLFDKEKDDDRKNSLDTNAEAYESPFSDVQEASLFLLKKAFNTLNNFPALSHGPEIRNSLVSESDGSTKETDPMLFSSFDSIVSFVQVDSETPSNSSK
jgi:hypothetical protein